MKKLILILALSGSGTIFANFSFEVCKEAICTPYFDGNLDEFMGFETTFAEKKKPTRVKKPDPGTATFISFLAGATGHAMGYVSSAVNSIKTGVIAAGYDRFEGKLSGPSGTVEFTYDLKTDKWTIKN